jgi:Raf kinase inhibitor-like YbhB/YbcL family protein
MLENIPKAVGKAMHAMRAGADKLAINSIDAPMTIAVESAAFAGTDVIPPRYTADGEGLSPELAWHGAPDGTACVALIIEDADAPTPQPLVHAIAPVLPAEGALAAGALNHGDVDTGRNSYLRAGYLPPDPPTGHGAHRYAFEVFALSDEPRNAAGIGRNELMDWIRPRVLAKGCLIGIYERA